MSENNYVGSMASKGCDQLRHLSESLRQSPTWKASNSSSGRHEESPGSSLGGATRKRHISLPGVALSLIWAIDI